MADITTGTLHSQQLYRAWGETRYISGTLPTRYTYTGQYSYANDFGLVFYGSRFYDPLLARWASPDSIIPEAAQGTQAWDRYAYVNNSPINYNDPTGHCLVLCTAAIGSAIGAIVGAVGYTAYTVATGTEFNTGHMLMAAGGGAAAGALIGTGVGIAQGMSAAAATAASVTGAGAATTALNLTGGDPTDEIQAGSQAIGNLGQAANLTIQQGSQAINTGTNSVYSLVENGITRYVGITGNMGRRTAEHIYQRGWTVNPIDGLQNLSRSDARATEQVLIERYGLPNLYNQINSIAAKNPIYTKAIQRGKEILDIVGIK